MAEVPDELIKLERSAEEERAKLAGLSGDAYDAQLRRWHKASEAVQAAISAHAAATSADRCKVEQAVKRALWHSQEDPTVE
ncbi:hypothetical protein [Streptomyces sp. CoH27]|uniref:hypothetical protein n=1 Tax=Streptomyces sp. CoH27 TaxID=2875763 RepID=UPI001CD7A86A|nr:hypothetical protein [Streptomyces sp. CoH27]